MDSYLGIIIAVVGSGLAIIFSIFAMMFWIRQEANALRKEAMEDRKDLVQITRSMEITLLAIKEEIKDFHGRLCILEERSR